MNNENYIFKRKTTNENPHLITDISMLHHENIFINPQTTCNHLCMTISTQVSLLLVNS